MNWKASLLGVKIQFPSNGNLGYVCTVYVTHPFTKPVTPCAYICLSVGSHSTIQPFIHSFIHLLRVCDGSDRVAGTGDIKK